MAAGTTALTKNMDQIVTLVGAVTGISSARTYAGKKHFTDAQNLENIIKALSDQSQGIFAIWFKDREVDTQIRPGTYIYGALIGVPLEYNTTTDCNTLYDLLESILTAIFQENEYTSWGSKPIAARLVETPDEDTIGITFWELELEFQAPLICGSL